MVVTTKANNTILTFHVGDEGRLAPNPVVNAPTGAVPFAFESTRSGDLAVVEAGSSSVTTYHVNDDGTLTSLSSVAEGQKAPCWISRIGDRFYLGNTGSANLSAVRIDAAGQGSLVGPTGIVTTTGAGPIDIAVGASGQLLYSQQGGAHAVETFRVNADGTLASVGSVISSARCSWSVPGLRTLRLRRRPGALGS